VAALFACAGAATCVLVTIVLATGLVVGHGLPAVATAAFLLVAAWCFSHHRLDHTLVALALYLGLLDGYVKLRTGSTTVTLARDALVIAIAAGALLRSVVARERLALPPLGGFVVVFCGIVLIELANPSSRGLVAGLAGLRQHLEFVPLFFLGYAVVRTESKLRTLLFVLVFCAAVGGVVSFIQSTLSPEQLAGWGPGYRERIFGTGIFTGAGRVASVGTTTFVRPFGLGSDAGGGAVTAALALPGLVALLLLGKGSARWAMLPMSIGVGLAVATSGSRGALVLVFVTLVVFGLTAAASKNALRAVIGIALGVALIYAAFIQLGPGNGSTERAKSVAPGRALSTFQTERGSSVSAFGGLASDHPLGVGVGTSGPAARVQLTAGSTAYNTETEWNFLIVESGIAGLVVYVVLLLRLAWLAFTRIRRIDDPALRLQLAALAAPVVAMLFAGFSGATSASVPTAPYLWIVTGILAHWLVTRQRAERARIEPIPVID
jgi:uncharacterized membrane protein YbaN (DUF454 family)